MCAQRCQRKNEAGGPIFATAFRPQNNDTKVRHLTVDASLWRRVFVTGNEADFCDRFVGRRRRLGGGTCCARIGSHDVGWWIFCAR